MLPSDKKQTGAQGSTEVSKNPVGKPSSGAGTGTGTAPRPKIAPKPSTQGTPRPSTQGTPRPSTQGTSHSSSTGVPRHSGVGGQSGTRPAGGVRANGSGIGSSAKATDNVGRGTEPLNKRESRDGLGFFSILTSRDLNPFASVKKYNTPCIIVIAVMVLYLISEVLLSGNYINSENPYITVVIAQICVYLLPCAFFLAFSSLREGFSVRDLGFSLAPLRLTGFCIASLFALVVGGMLIKYSTYLIFGTVSSSAISVSASNDILYVMLSGVVIPAITEELLFRGVLYGAYEKKLGGIGAILITSVLFAFIHFDTVNFASYLYAGLVLGIAACVTRSVFAPLLLHLLNNFICIFSDTYLQRISKESISTVFVIFILGVILLVILFFYFESLELYCREMALSDIKGQNKKTTGLFIEGEARYVMLIRGFLAPAFLVAAALYFVKVLLL